jgi:hypothetical protein
MKSMKHVIELRRRENLFSMIRQGKDEKRGLELIIGTSPGRQAEAAEKMRRLGRLTRVYDTIPFFSLVADADDAGCWLAIFTGGESRRWRATLQPSGIPLAACWTLSLL